MSGSPRALSTYVSGGSVEDWAKEELNAGPLNLDVSRFGKLPVRKLKSRRELAKATEEKARSLCAAHPFEDLLAPLWEDGALDFLKKRLEPFLRPALQDVKHMMRPFESGSDADSHAARALCL